MSLAKWMAKYGKGKGSKIGEIIGDAVGGAAGTAAGILSSAKKAGPKLAEAGVGAAKAAAHAHPGKTAAAAGTAGILAAVGLSADDDDGLPEAKAPKTIPKKAGTKKPCKACDD